MDEFAFFGLGFAACAWGVSRLIDAGTRLWNVYTYHKENA